MPRTSHHTSQHFFPFISPTLYPTATILPIHTPVFSLSFSPSFPSVPHHFPPLTPFPPSHIHGFSSRTVISARRVLRRHLRHTPLPPRSPHTTCPPHTPSDSDLPLTSQVQTVWYCYVLNSVVMRTVLRPMPYVCTVQCVMCGAVLYTDVRISQHCAFAYYAVVVVAP